MFKFIFDLVTEPLGLPIEWYKEWIILAIIERIGYYIAYEKVNGLYHSHMISGGMSGSFFHWVIKSFYVIVIWAITYCAIAVGKFVLENKVLIGVIAGTVLLIIIAVKVFLWKQRTCKIKEH